MAYTVRNFRSYLRRHALLSIFNSVMVHNMAGSSLFATALFTAVILAGIPLDAAEPSMAAAAKFRTYIDTVESRLAFQHGDPAEFLASEDTGRLRRGELIIEKLAPDSQNVFPGAMLHHWRGTAFVPGASAADFDGLMKNFSAYPQVYAPEVTQARILSHEGGHFQVQMRVRQKHVLTVVLDTSYDVSFGHLDAKHGFSTSRSTRVAEIANAGSAEEHALSDAESHGFLWRLNTYWSSEERDGGLYIQIESVSLTRSIPTGLGWVIGPFVESVPRESLEFTLRATSNALRRQR